MNHANLINSNVVRSLYGLLALITFSCSTIPKDDIPANAMPSEEVAKLDASIQEGFKNQYDVLADEDFSKAAKYNMEAKKKLQDGKSSEEILDKVAYGKGYYEIAKNKADVRRSHVEGILKAREAALSANILHTDLEKKLEKIDDQLRSNADDFAHDLSAKEFAKLQKDYYDLELISIQKRQLAASQNLMMDAEKNGAVKLAPKTYKQTQNDIEDAKNAIAADRHNASAYQAPLDRAYDSSKTLYDVTTRINSFSPKMSEDAALKIVMQEREINNLQGNLGDEKNMNVDLNKNLNKKELVLAKLKSKEQRQETIAAVQNNFSEDEAEIYQQGDKVVIRLKKINFPSGSAKIPPKSESLLSKVLQTIDRLEPSEIKVEGHSDAVGSSIQNLTLSQKRAEEIAKYLKKDSAMDATVEAVGFGFEKPIASNKTAIGRAQNRRVDLIITPKTSAQ